MAPNHRNAEEYLEYLLSESGNEPVDKDAEKIEIELPPYFNSELFKKGQKGYLKYATGMTTGMLVGLLAVLAIPTILQVLICSKKSGTALDAYRRYVRTIYHVVSWHDHEMKPDTKAWQSITIVRKTHLAARQMCEHAEQITITQRDMALTQFGFLGFIVLKPQSFGIPNDPELMEAIVHVWHVVGYMMGIKEEFNLCTDSVEVTRNRLQAVMDRIYRPALERDDTKVEFMCKAVIDGLWHSDLVLSFRPIMCFVKRIAECRGYECFRKDFKQEPTEQQLKELKYKQMPWYQRVLFIYYIIKFEYLYPKLVFRILFNLNSFISMLFGYYLPLMAIYNFGIKKSYVRIFRGKSTSPNKHYG